MHSLNLPLEIAAESSALLASMLFLLSFSTSASILFAHYFSTTSAISQFGYHWGPRSSELSGVSSPVSSSICLRKN